MRENLISVDVTFDGYEFHEDDLDALREEFSAVGPVHANGGWGPAAIPAATVEIILTFFGEAMAAVLLEKTLERTVEAVAAGWKRYRDRRHSAGRQEPRISRLVLRASDFDIEIDGVVDLEMLDLLALLGLMTERTRTGELKNAAIRRIQLPSKRDHGEWRSLKPFEPAEGADFDVWNVWPKSADGRWGFYNARKDKWPK